MQYSNHVPKNDVAAIAIDAVFRTGRWLIESAMLCILGFMLFSGLSTVLTVVSAAFMEQAIPGLLWLPAVGWWVGFTIALVRVFPVFHRPFVRPDENRCKSTETDQSKANTPAIEPQPLNRRMAESIKGTAFLGFIGGILGVFLSIYLCVVATAAILSPIAPDAWSWQMAVQSIDQADLEEVQRRRQRSEGSGMSAGTTAHFWHPIFAPIFIGCTVACCVGGGILGAILGWRFPDSDSSESSQSGYES